MTHRQSIVARRLSIYDGTCSREIGWLHVLAIVTCQCTRYNYSALVRCTEHLFLLSVTLSRSFSNKSIPLPRARVLLPPVLLLTARQLLLSSLLLFTFINKQCYCEGEMFHPLMILMKRPFKLFAHLTRHLQTCNLNPFTLSTCSRFIISFLFFLS